MHTRYYIPRVKDCNVIIDGRNLFDKPMKNYLKTYNNIARLPMVKEMITQLAFYWIIPFSRNITS